MSQPIFITRSIGSLGARTIHIEVTREDAEHSLVTIRKGRQIHARRRLGDGETLTICLPIDQEQP